MEIGKRLFTKNGKNYGNAIIVNKYKCTTQIKLDLYDILIDGKNKIEGLTSRYIRYNFFIQ